MPAEDRAHPSARPIVTMLDPHEAGLAEGNIMGSTTLEGQGQNIVGHVKEAAGSVTGDSGLKASGIADQMAGNAKEMVGAASDALANPGPLIEKAKAFAKERPWATAALVGTLGIALLNTLRGK